MNAMTADWLTDSNLPPAPEFRTWLDRHLDNDWNRAEAAGHGDPRVQYVGRYPNAGWVELDLTDNVRPSYDLRFAREHGPRRVVAEVEAKRALVDLHSDRSGYCSTCGGGWPCLTLRLIAAPYAADPARVSYPT